MSGQLSTLFFHRSRPAFLFIPLTRYTWHLLDRLDLAGNELTWVVLRQCCQDVTILNARQELHGLPELDDLNLALLDCLQVVAGTSHAFYLQMRVSSEISSGLVDANASPMSRASAAGLGVDFVHNFVQPFLS